MGDSKTLNLRLHKIVGSKEDTVMLTGIKANFNDAYTANLMLDNVLNDELFVDQLTEEPTVFEIVDTNDEYEISSVDDYVDDFACSGFRSILCAALKFNMDMQILYWKVWGNDKLASITNDMLYVAQDCVKKYGMWVIEFKGEITTEMLSSSCIKSFELSDEYYDVIDTALKNSISEFVDTLNFEYPNFSHDIQNELDYTIRRLTEIINLQFGDC